MRLTAAPQPACRGSFFQLGHTGILNRELQLEASLLPLNLPRRDFTVGNFDRTPEQESVGIRRHVIKRGEPGVILRKNRFLIRFGKLISTFNRTAPGLIVRHPAHLIDKPGLIFAGVR